MHVSQENKLTSIARFDASAAIMEPKDFNSSGELAGRRHKNSDNLPDGVAKSPPFSRRSNRI